MEITLEMHPTAATPGAWCDACLLPSAVLVHGAVAESATLRVVGSFDIAFCGDCGMERAARQGDPVVG